MSFWDDYDDDCCFVDSYDYDDEEVCCECLSLLCNCEEVKEQYRAEVPMQYEDMTTFEVLTQVSDELNSRISSINTDVNNAITTMNQTGVILAKIQKDMILLVKQKEDIDEYLQNHKNTKRSKIDPSKCRHLNKRVDNNGNIETVTCEDCDLLLSYSNN